MPTEPWLVEATMLLNQTTGPIWPPGAIPRSFFQRARPAPSIVPWTACVVNRSRSSWLSRPQNDSRVRAGRRRLPWPGEDLRG
jgi:hypothetical protein